MLKGVVALLAAVLLTAAPLCSGQEYPTLEYYVTDETGVLYGGYDIEELCMYVYDNTGAEMAVLVVNTTQPYDIFTFTYETFQQNGLGQEGEDNGLLLVLSTDENLWRVEVGYGLHGILPDSRVGTLGRELLEPQIEAGDYYTGVYDFVNNLGGIILDEYDGEPPEDPYPIGFIPLTFWQLVIVAGIVIFLTVITRGRILFFLPYLIGKGGGKNWGGGKSGGGGAGGRWK